ncbi:hypothetical protein CHARACLAT_019382, partial [Characodon lateralis]|nr:hypothetical protein [Characodon lateralis]
MSSFDGFSVHLAADLGVDVNLCEKELTEESSSEYLMPCRRGPGSCLQTLVDFLLETHNALVREARRVSRQEDSDYSVPLERISETQLTLCHPERELLPLVLASCNYTLQKGGQTDRSYDLLVLQTQLARRFLAGKPLIQADTARYRNRRLQDFSVVLTEVRRKICQEALKGSVSSATTTVLRSYTDVCDAVFVVEIGLRFLGKAGGDPEGQLLSYLTDSLKMGPQISNNVAKGLGESKLKHSIFTWQLLNSWKSELMLNRKQDPFQKLRSEFQQKLSEEERRGLKAFLTVTDVEAFALELHEILLLKTSNAVPDEGYQPHWDIRSTLEIHLEQKDLPPLLGLEDLPENITLGKGADVWRAAVEETFLQRRNRIYFPGFSTMHTTRSPSSIPTSSPGDAPDLSLLGSRLSVSKRPSSASPGKHFSRSVSVFVAADGRGKRNALSYTNTGSCRSIKNLRRSNSTSQVNQQAKLSLSQEHSEDYLTLFDGSSDGRKKLASLRKTSPERTTWNILDDQPRTFPPYSTSRSTGNMDSPTSLKKKEPGIPLAATFTANNRSNKGAVGNSVTTILHNNYSDKPLTPKSSNQKPSFNNILKATANDEVLLENGSVTKSQKNFCSSSSISNNRSLVSAQHCSPVPPRRREVTEEEAERFIQQVNQAAVTIQRWYRCHIKRKQSHQVALEQILTNKRKECEGRREEDDHLEQQQQRRGEERKRIREEKARLARLSAIQELQQKRAQQTAEVHQAAESELENLWQTGGAGRKKQPEISITSRSPTSPNNNSSPMSLTDTKTKNTDSNLNITADLGELGFRAISPALSSKKGSQCSQELQQRPAQWTAEERHVSEVELENQRQIGAEGQKKLLRIPPTNNSLVSLSNNNPKSPTDTKTKNTDFNLNVVNDGSELGFRAVSPVFSHHRGSQCSQRSVSVEDQRQVAQSKTALNELLDTLKLLEQEPEKLSEPRCYRKEKYAWIDEDGDSLTTDNLERHGQLNHNPALPDRGALLSEAKLQSIMSFLDEMEKSEQERPRSVTSGSHRE